MRSAGAAGFTFTPTGTEKAPSPHIILLGDAILDNFYWLNNPREDLSHALTQLAFRVDNYAVDETKVSNFLNGLKPNSLYTMSRTYPYTIDKDNRLNQMTRFLDHFPQQTGFASVYGSRQDNEHMVVLSLGGNDVQAQVSRVVLGFNFMINSILTEQFVQNYQSILHNIKRRCAKIVLISLYIPYLGKNGSYAHFSKHAKKMTTHWNNFLHSMAEMFNIPILDLSRTIDPSNRSHYSDKSDTHMSDVASACMAECLAHIYQHYTGFATYYAPGCRSADIRCD